MTRVALVVVVVVVVTTATMTMMIYGGFMENLLNEFQRLRMKLLNLSDLIVGYISNDLHVVHIA